jgi:hypothetical protein
MRTGSVEESTVGGRGGKLEDRRSLLTSRHPKEEEEFGENSIDDYDVSSSHSTTIVKCILAGILFSSAILAYVHPSTMSLGALLSSNGSSISSSSITGSSSSSTLQQHHDAHHRRRLTAMSDIIPSYVEPLLTDLKGRKKLFDDTPPEEIKYWFEYAGPLQVSGLYEI